MPAAVATKGHDRDGTFRPASLDVKRPQQPVDAIGVLFECRASASATSDVAAQFVARRVERHPDGGAGTRLRRRHEGNISGCGCGCQALQAQARGRIQTADPTPEVTSEGQVLARYARLVGETEPEGSDDLCILAPIDRGRRITERLEFDAAVHVP